MALKIRSTENRTFSRTVELVGRLDNETVASLDEELDRLTASDVTVVVFDLAGLEYISSVGLRSIFRTQKAMAARSGKALLVNPRPQVRKVLEIVGRRYHRRLRQHRSSIATSTSCSARSLTANS